MGFWWVPGIFKRYKNHINSDMFFGFIIIPPLIPFGLFFFFWGWWDGKVVGIGTTGLAICHVGAKCDTTLWSSILDVSFFLRSTFGFHMVAHLSTVDKCPDVRWRYHKFQIPKKKKKRIFRRRRRMSVSDEDRPKWFYCHCCCCADRVWAHQNKFNPPQSRYADKNQPPPPSTF